MDDTDSSCDFLQILLKDFLSNFCHICVEKICNESLKNVLKLKIDSPEKRVNCYLVFLREKILDIEIECKNNFYGCKEKVMFGEMDQHLECCEFTEVKELINNNISKDPCIKNHRKNNLLKMHHNKRFAKYPDDEEEIEQHNKPLDIEYQESTTISQEYLNKEKEMSKKINKTQNHN